MGGQFWAGGWGWWGAAFTSYFREVCNLELKGDLWDRGKAYEATVESACWWWPHRRFVMVSERPLEIHREQIGPRGWGSHRLHCDDGPAVSWGDGFGIWAVHGVRVPQQVVEAPDTLTVKQIRDEQNSEVRRVMMDRFTAERFMRESEATLVATDDWGKLWSIPNAPDEPRKGVPLVMVEMVNSTPEPDGSWKTYYERVMPTAKTPLEALAWQADLPADVYATIESQS